MKQQSEPQGGFTLLEALAAAVLLALMAASVAATLRFTARVGAEQPPASWSIGCVPPQMVAAPPGALNGQTKAFRAVRLSPATSATNPKDLQAISWYHVGSDTDTDSNSGLLRLIADPP